MSGRLVITLAVALCLVLAAAGLLQRELSRSRAENRRLSGNQEALLTPMKTYRVSAGGDTLQAAQVRALQLELGEVRALRSRDAALIRALGLRLRDAQAVSKTAVRTETTVEAPVRDSVVQGTAGTDTLRCLRYSDRWLTLDGCLDTSGRFRGTVVSVDTIVAVPSLIRRRFLFLRWGVKGVQLTATSRNPHARIYLQEYYQIGR